jgi:hypothetical protein
MLALTLLLATATAGAPAPAVTVHVTRTVPEKNRSKNFKESEDVSVPADNTGCPGVSIESGEWTFKVDPTDLQHLISIQAAVTLHKTTANALSAPTLGVVMEKETATFELTEAAFADDWVEPEARVTAGFFNEKLTEPKGWKTLTLTCHAVSPFTAAAIPEGVVYKRSA